MTVKDGEFNQHFVCTYEEARRIVEDKTEFFVSKCGCREGKGTCQRSSHEVCLTFEEGALASTQDKRRIGIDEILTILSEAAGKRLVPRPFRDPYDRESVVGICLCCDDCCAYFTGCDSECDKGSLIERTELDQCTQCGQCVSVCYFGSRQMHDGELSIDGDRCYGCGLCEAVCPEGCIAMVDR